MQHQARLAQPLLEPDQLLELAQLRLDICGGSHGRRTATRGVRGLGADWARGELERPLSPLLRMSATTQFSTYR